MGLHGKLIATFKAGGDVFHELFRYNTQHISTATPDKVQGCDLHEGEFGHVGTIICWRYIHDGKEKKAKQIIQAIDEEKKLIEFKMLEGELMEQYKDFVITTHIETKGDTDIDLVTEYEMLNEEVGHPISPSMSPKTSKHITLPNLENCMLSSVSLIVFASSCV